MKKIFWIMIGLIVFFVGAFAFSEHMDKEIEAAFRYEPKGIE